MSPNESPAPKNTPKESPAGCLLVLAVLGCLWFGAKLLYALHDVSETDQAINSYSSISDVPKFVFVKAFALRDERNRTS